MSLIGDVYKVEEIEPHVIHAMNGEYETIGAMLSKGNMMKEHYLGDILAMVETATDVDLLWNLFMPRLENLPSWLNFIGGR